MYPSHWLGKPNPHIKNVPPKGYSNDIGQCVRLAMR